MTAGVLAPPRRLSAVVWAPAEAALAAMGASDEVTLGLHGPIGDWLPATSLSRPEGVAVLLGAAARRWNAPAHAAATLAWKSYSYWAALPVVLSWAAARRVPLLTAENTYAHIHDEAPFLRIGVTDVPFAVLPGDPLAQLAGSVVVESEEALLATVRHVLFDQHLDPLLDAIRAEVHVGRRTLMGSVASGIAYGIIRASDAVPGSTQDVLAQLLTALDLDDLVDIVRGPSGLMVQRKTCCLAFTLDEPKICSGCCLRS
jgi:Ferric iron reductase FhuF-like transporter